MGEFFAIDFIKKQSIYSLLILYYYFRVCPIDDSGCICCFLNIHALNFLILIVALQHTLILSMCVCVCVYIYIYIYIYIYNTFLIAEWNKDPEANFTDVWPGWNKTIKDCHPDIDNISKKYRVSNPTS